MKSLVLASLVAVTSFGELDEPFLEIDFEAALQEAQDSDKVVFIDFFTTWCGPCKRLDQVTWRDERVVEWLREGTVPLKIDAEKEVALARRFDVDAYPSLVFVRSDGSLLGRIVGFREPADFLREARDIISGIKRLDHLREELARSPKDPSTRMDLARELVREGALDEALEQFLWCFDHGADSPGFGGVRLSFLLGDITRLGKRYPKALEALRERRDTAKGIVLGPGPTLGATRDYGSLNDNLGESEDTLGVYDQLLARRADPSGPGERDSGIGDRRRPGIDPVPLLFDDVKELLFERGRFQNLVDGYGSPFDWLDTELQMMTRNASLLDDDESYLEYARGAIRSEAVRLYQSLLALGGRNDEAQRFSSHLVNAVPGADTWRQLISAAGEAGREDVQSALRESALAALPEEALRPTPVERPSGEEPAPNVLTPERPERADPLPFWCRVVREDGGAPITGAVVRPNGRHGYPVDRSCPFEAPLHTDARGLVDLTQPEGHWRGFRVDAPGFGPALFGPPDVPSTSDRPLEIELRDSATLRARVTRDGGPVVGATVEIEAPLYSVVRPRGIGAGTLDGIRWSRETDGTGSVEFVDLLSEAALSVRVLHDGEAVLRLPGALALEPGESRVVDWTLGAGSHVVAVLSDQHGVPITDREVWIVTSPSNAREDDGKIYLQMSDRSQLIADSRSDALGRCEFRDVPAGRYYLGIAVSESAVPPEDRSQVAPVALPLDVAPGMSKVQVTLEASRGLYIRGRVICPDGEDVRLTQIYARSQYGDLQLTERGDSFRLGPLEPVEHRLVAFGGGAFSDSAAVTVLPGSDVELILTEGGAIAVTFVDAETREPCEARAALVALGRGGRSFRPALLPRVTFGGLRPGVYQVSGSTADGRFGRIERIEIAAGERKEDLVVEVRPGATLTVRHDDDRAVARCDVLLDGTRIAVGTVAPGTPFTATVPAGTVKLELSVEEEVVGERSVTCLAGEKREITISLK